MDLLCTAFIVLSVILLVLAPSKLVLFRCCLVYCFACVNQLYIQGWNSLGPGWLYCSIHSAPSFSLFQDSIWQHSSAGRSRNSVSSCLCLPRPGNENLHCHAQPWTVLPTYLQSLWKLSIVFVALGFSVKGDTDFVRWGHKCSSLFPFMDSLEGHIW